LTIDRVALKQEAHVGHLNSSSKPPLNGALIAELHVGAHDLPVGGFIVLEYLGGAPGKEPYAQVLRRGHSLHVEVVSEHFLPTSVWPIDERWLTRSGWRLPPDYVPGNWWLHVQDARSASYAMVAALVRGRLCGNPEAFRWYDGRLATPDGGEPGQLHARASARAA